jgi:hypothetical protein
VREWLSNPLLAAALGLLVGASIARINRFGAEFMTPEDTTGAGFGMALGTILGGLLLAMGTLVGYRVLAPKGIGYFGVALVSSMLIVTVVVLMPAMRETRTGNKGR